MTESRYQVHRSSLGIYEVWDSLYGVRAPYTYTGIYRATAQQVADILNASTEHCSSTSALEPSSICATCGEDESVCTCVACSNRWCTNTDHDGKVCDRCEQCDHCCDCAWCECCESKVDSVCRECESCENCCDCTYCNCCDNVAEYLCDECERCEDCCNCVYCDCEAPHQHFTFPNNGFGTVEQDERITVELPSGVISDQGLRDVTRMLQGNLDVDHYYRIQNIIDGVGPDWQTKRGNFTRRLSSALHKAGIKIPKSLLSDVGNIVRSHTSAESSWCVEFTRDLNQDADYFYHGGSCWFTKGEFGKSRCALKSWGGLALRSFRGPDDDHDNPNGRVWVQPITAELVPTHDAVNASAYVVYNGYGALGGYTAARIIAHLTSKTYRKITFNAENQYINSAVGYIVGDESMISEIGNLDITGDEHERFDA